MGQLQTATDSKSPIFLALLAFFDHILNFELDQPFYMPVSGEDTRFLHYLCRRPCPKKLTCAITDEIKGSYLLSEMTFTEEGITFARTNLNGFHVGHSHYIRVMTPKEYEEAFQEEEEGEAMMGGGNNIPAEWNEEMEMEVWD